MSNKRKWYIDGNDPFPYVRNAETGEVASLFDIPDEEIKESLGDAVLDIKRIAEKVEEKRKVKEKNIAMDTVENVLSILESVVGTSKKSNEGVKK